MFKFFKLTLCKEDAQMETEQAQENSFMWPYGLSLRFSVHGILQARILEWVVMPSSMRSSRPRDQTHVSCIAGKFFAIWATREARTSLVKCKIQTMKGHHYTPKWLFFLKWMLLRIEQLQNCYIASENSKWKIYFGKQLSSYL